MKTYDSKRRLRGQWDTFLHDEETIGFFVLFTSEGVDEEIQTVLQPIQTIEYQMSRLILIAMDTL